MTFVTSEIIKKTRNGQELNKEELAHLIGGFVANQIPDYQISAWLMSVYFRGLSKNETLWLTELMKNSGYVFDLKHLGKTRVDKHSTGGVGDKTSIILAPLVAACGGVVPMVAGRGLGHTGGTLDKLESIPGFRIGLSTEEFVRNLEKFGFSIMGQTENLCPADRKMYALRDVTATVESQPLICASIMSKKLAEDLAGLVLDVKFGSGAFMKSQDNAVRLAQALVNIGVASGLKMTALITDMNQPLGAYIGNALEIKECVEILQGQKKIHKGVDLYADTRELTLELAAHMLYLAGLVDSVESGRAKAQHRLDAGLAFQNFEKMCQFQGPSDWRKLPTAKHHKVLLAQKSGVITAVNCEKLGLAGLILGAGRTKVTDIIDPTAGIEIHFKLGQTVARGEPLATLFANNSTLFDSVEKIFFEHIEIGEIDVTKRPLVAQIINGGSQ